MNTPRFTKAQVHLMCDMMDEHGLTAREVGEKFGISKNAVIGLRRRAGRSSTPGKPPGSGPAKPCLRCGSTDERDPAHRLCDKCKSADVFGGVYGAF